VRRRCWRKSIKSITSIAVCTVAVTIVGVGVPVASAHPNVDPAPVVAPDAARSTSGDYATDVFSDPWDFSNDEDVPPIALVGAENSYGITRNGNGTLTVASVNNSTIKLVRTWGDCYGYLLIASGWADLSLDPIMNPWDIAALVPVVRGAGGVITDWSGGPAYPATSTVAAATPELHVATLALLLGR
jgi:3'-phosphoadenosine 5'-phosphosulfate (PAPS) 3'-phosphatase